MLSLTTLPPGEIAPELDVESGQKLPVPSSDTARRHRQECPSVLARHTWESVATSWTLPDSIQVVWRLSLLIAVLSVARPRASALHAGLVWGVALAESISLSLVMVFGFVRNEDTVDSRPCRIMWFTTATLCAFATAQAIVAAALAAAVVAVLGVGAHVDTRAGWLAGWLGAELVLGIWAVGIIEGIAALAVWTVVVGGATAGWWDAGWVAAVARLHGGSGAVVLVGLFGGALVGVAMVATGRRAVARILERRRDVAHVERDKTTDMRRNSYGGAGADAEDNDR